MTWEKLIQIYADVNYINAAAVEEDFRKGWISKEMLLEAWLEDEGIFGYTHLILNVIEIIDKHTV